MISTKSGNKHLIFAILSLFFLIISQTPFKSVSSNTNSVLYHVYYTKNNDIFTKNVVLYNNSAFHKKIR